MKKIVRLTENDLHKIIGESVKKILKEGGYIGHDRAEDEFEAQERERDRVEFERREFERMKKMYPNRPPLWYTEHFDEFYDGRDLSKI